MDVLVRDVYSNTLFASLEYSRGHYYSHLIPTHGCQPISLSSSRRFNSLLLTTSSTSLIKRKKRPIIQPRTPQQLALNNFILPTTEESIQLDGHQTNQERLPNWATRSYQLSVSRIRQCRKKSSSLPNREYQFYHRKPRKEIRGQETNKQNSDQLCQ